MKRKAILVVIHTCQKNTCCLRFSQGFSIQRERERDREKGWEKEEDSNSRKVERVRQTDRQSTGEGERERDADSQYMHTCLAMQRGCVYFLTSHYCGVNRHGYTSTGMGDSQLGGLVYIATPPVLSDLTAGACGQHVQLTSHPELYLNLTTLSGR